MTLANIQQQLSTPEGFAAAVSPKKGLLGGAITCFVVAAGAIVLNLVQLGGVFDWDFEWMMPYFFSMDFEYSGRAGIYRFLAVWLPVILIPLGIILLVLHFSTAKNKGTALFESYQQRGFVGAQAPLVLTLQNGNQTQALSLFGRADAEDGVLQQTSQNYNNYIASLDKKATKAASTTAMKAKAMTGTPANTVDPQLPAQLIVAPEVKDSPLVVVVPPEMGSNKFTILPIKQK